MTRLTIGFLLMIYSTFGWHQFVDKSPATDSIIKLILLVAHGFGFGMALLAICAWVAE